LTGSARLSQEAREKAEALQRSQSIEERRRSMAQRRKAVEAQIAALRASLADEEARAGRILVEDERRESRILQDAMDIANRRKSNSIEKRRAHSAG
jgi:circadian clock protein KaiC